MQTLLGKFLPNEINNVISDPFNTNIVTLRLLNSKEFCSKLILGIKF